MKLNLSPLTLLFFALYLLTVHDLTLVYTVSAIIIHELTHLAVLYLCNGRAAKLTVTPIGLSIDRCGLLSHFQEALLSFSAPTVNLLLAGVFYVGNLSPFAVYANLTFGLFNLLPILPLDGAKGLHALLCLQLPAELAERIGKWISIVFLFFLWLFSIAIALFSDSNLSLLLLCAALFFANSSQKNCAK
ncbi:MAG: hypothetical protein IJ955_09890 [Oscillospiraceae bacterium]|nr:hypothetical protein [Oscillospiraceae bacterium]